MSLNNNKLLGCDSSCQLQFWGKINVTGRCALFNVKLHFLVNVRACHVKWYIIIAVIKISAEDEEEEDDDVEEEEESEYEDEEDDEEDEEEDQTKGTKHPLPRY